MGLRNHIWRPAIVGAPIAEIVRRGSIAGLPLHWLPPAKSFCFLADPFGFWRDGRLHVFVEAYDYRVCIGAIEVLTYDADLMLIDRQWALREPWHLSYPVVWEADGDTWMLPEAHRSHGLTLYRATDFPIRWEVACRLDLNHIAIDTTPLWHDGLWWLFYTSGPTKFDKMAKLHIAFAERLTGPWRAHPQNPVRVDIASARPGGTACVIDGRVMLPVQDCSRTYGGAIRPLWFDRLDTAHADTRPGAAIGGGDALAPFDEGFHTLSAAGDVTLIDVKRTILSLQGLSIEALRKIRTLRARSSSITRVARG